MIPSLRNHYHSRKPVSGIFFFYKYEQHRSILQPILSKYLETADTYRYAASLLPDLPKYHSLPPEALVGWTPSNHLNDAFSASSQSSTGWVDRFREQRDFVEFMHAVIGKCVAVADLGVRTRARGVGNGWVHVCDERALCPLGRFVLFLYSYTTLCKVGFRILMTSSARFM